MSIRLRVCSTYPPNSKIIKVSNSDWGTLKETIVKALELDVQEIKKYSWAATRFGEDVVQLDKLEDKDKHGLTDKSTVFVMAPASMLGPLRRRGGVKGDGKEEEEENSRFRGLTPENILKKIQVSQGKKKKIAFEYLDTFTSDIIKGKAWTNQSKESLITVLRRDSITASEIELFEAVVRWAEAECKRKDLRSNTENKKKVLEDVIVLIRFPAMQTEEVASKVGPSNLLDQQQILDLFTYLAQREVGAKPGKSLAVFSVKPRKADAGGGGALCKLPSDLHTDQGVFYTIGTNFGKQAHRNPHTAGLIHMSTSPSPSWTSGWSEVNLVDSLSTARTLRTDYCMNSGTFFMVDLKEFRCAVTHYSMQNGGGRGIVLRDWTFDAKKRESDAWTTLRTHTSDTTYANDGSGGFGIHGFEVDNAKKEYYRFFRINRTDSSRAIYVHRWELYGWVRKANKGE